MTRVFSNAAGQDGSFSQNLDSVTGTAIGLTMPGQTINYICATVANGLGLFRIIDSQSNKIYVQGICSETSYVDPAECRIPNLIVRPSMILQVYSLATDSSALESNSLGLVTTNRGVEAFICQNSIDGVAKEFTSIISGLGVGNLLFGSTLQRVQVAVEKSAFLTGITVVDASGGTQYTGRGSTKLPTAGATSTQVNGDFPCAITLTKGFTLNLITKTA